METVIADSVKVRNNLLFAMAFLPSGFRFHPTDEEVVKNYLSGIQEFIVMPQIDICMYEPEELPIQFQIRSNDLDGWFLCKQERPKKSTGKGYWKIIGKPSDVKSSNTNQIIGTKRFLSFYRRVEGSTHVRTNWVMHEYDLPNGNMTDLVLCHVMLKRYDTAVSIPSLSWKSDTKDLMDILVASEPEDRWFGEASVNFLQANVVEVWDTSSLVLKEGKKEAN